MRQVQHGRKPRGRGRKQHNPLSRIYDSSGPETKIRGTAAHIAEKYQSLARDATSSGHRIVAENYLQHAEHYLRIVAVAQAAMQPPVQAGSGQVNSGQSDQAPPSERRENGDENNAVSADNPQGPRGESGSQPSNRNRRNQRRRPPVIDTPDIAAPAENPAAAEPEAAPVLADETAKKPPRAKAVDAGDASVNGASKPAAAPATPAPRRRTRRKPKATDTVKDTAKDSDISADADTAEIV